MLCINSTDDDGEIRGPPWVECHSRHLLSERLTTKGPRVPDLKNTNPFSMFVLWVATLCRLALGDHGPYYLSDGLSKPHLNLCDM